MSHGLETSNGIKLVHHGGNNIWFTSDILPDHGIGVVVLTNAVGANAFMNAIKRRLLAIVFDGKLQPSTKRLKPFPRSANWR
jgi:hypothetical protein